MEVNDYYNNDQNSTEEEESSLLKRLIALKKQLEDDEPKLIQTLNNTKENDINNKNVISSSKFKYRKINNHNIKKFLSTKIDNRNLIKNQSKIKQNSLFIKLNNSSSKVHIKSNSLQLTPIISKKKSEIVNNSQSTKKYNLEINEIVKNSHVKNCKVLLNESYFETSDVSQTLLNVDKYMINIQDYLTSSKYVVNKEEVSSGSTNQTNNHVKNVYVNRKFQNKLISNSLLNTNSKSASSSKSTSIIKKKPNKRLSGKLIESPNLIKIGNTKLIRRSLFRNKWKINNKLNSVENNIIERKPLSTLQCPTSNSIIMPYNKAKWTKVTIPIPVLKAKSTSSNNTNKLKWTIPSILLINNKDNNNSLVPKSDKLILFGKNKIIRQSLIGSVQSKTKNYLLKHLTHRFALMRKLQLKNSSPKVKYNLTIGNEQVKKNNSLLKKTENKPIEIIRNGKRSYSMYSYINPTLRSKNNNNFSLDKIESSDVKRLRLSTTSNKNKPHLNLKIINNDKNKILHSSLINSKAVERISQICGTKLGSRMEQSKYMLNSTFSIRSKKTLTKQLCLVFNRLGICSKLNQGKCDKRHYKKFITLCTKFLIGECINENCTLSHNVVEEKIPFCKHYLNSVCIQLNCPYLHEYRDINSPICKDFLHGYCTQGKKCPKKHLNLCPIFETKKKCPHGQHCLYPHIQCEEKITVDVEINEPRYFEVIIPNSDESNENDSIHIVPKRRAPLTDLPSFIPLKKQ